MMSDVLTEIRKKLLQDDNIHTLLEKAECENIKRRSNRYEATLPSRFNSDNDRAVQVYLNESITCKIRSRTFLGKGIYDLISYIVFGCIEIKEINKCLPKSKRWICEQLGFFEYLNNSWYHEKPKEDPLKWLKDLKRKRNKEIKIIENTVLDDTVFNQYIMYPYINYLKEGIDYNTQLEFQIGLDLVSERVIFPIHNKYGDLIGIKGRTLDPDYKTKKIPKFMHLYNVNMISELYNWHRALYYIMEQKEIIFYEAEKTCWLSTQWGYRNCVALGSSEITEWHVQMVKELGLDIRIVLGYDKDKEAKEIKEAAKMFGFTHSINVMWDGRNAFSAEKKHSPTDLGKDAFDQLYNDRYKYKIT
jgi:DNA primase